MKNIILLADAYKYSHHKLYYPGTEYVYSYLESRGGKFNQTMFYGLQYYLKEYLSGPVITKEKIDEAELILTQVFNRTDVFDRKQFEYILNVHNGYLPIRIKAVPEGTVVDVHNVLMTIENTDPKCYWLTNFLESLIMQVWYSCTVGTLSREIKKIITDVYEQSATEESKAGIDFVLNDFGFRGASSVEAAETGGSAHLVNFRGSDGIAASVFAMKYYHTKTVYGLSIPATEHSICTLLGEKGELDIFRHVLNSFPAGIIACVSDSYDIFRACEQYWGTELKDQILNRDGVLVVRPDSGDPVKTLLTVFGILFKQFGYTTNDKGYKVLPPQIRVIQGDGINYESIKEIYRNLLENKISAENLVLGMGGALLQKVDRDTQKFAMKCSSVVMNGKEIPVQKNPKEMNADGVITESFKKSKAGKLKLIKLNGEYKTVAPSEHPECKDELITVFENGHLVKEYTFEEVREQARLTR